VEGARFYTPDDAERELALRLEQIRRARGLDDDRGTGDARAAPRRRRQG
jgi:hypothetical protein